MKKCSDCSFETKKTSNLKRHVQRFHGADLVKDIQRMDFAYGSEIPQN